MSFNGRTPAEYVAFLTDPGLQTCVGSVPLRAYVSTRARSPRAAALGQLLTATLGSFANSALDETPGTRRARRAAFAPRGWSGSVPTGQGDPLSAGLNRLERVHDGVAAHGRTAWRSVFSGQGLPQDIVEVMNFTVQQGDLMQAMTGSGHVLREYFSDGAPNLATLRRMVDDEVFGMDCLGFVGTYLVWCGVRSSYPRMSVSQYAESGISGCAPINSLDGVEARCFLLWAALDTQHIAIIDQVVERRGSGLLINLCQSSRGGPQTNVGVTLTHNGGGMFSISGGSPALPVAGGRIQVVRLSHW